MGPIRVNSDDWTGLDPARAAQPVPASKAYARMRKFSIAYGAFGLFYLGYTVGVMDEWQKLLMPAVHLLNAFVFFSIGKWSDPARTKR